MQLFPVGKVYNFMSQRRLFSIISLLMVFGSIGLLFNPGPQLGTDFQGGTELEVAFKQAVEPSAIRDAVTGSGFSSPDVIKVDDVSNPHRYLIRVQDVSTIGDALRARVEQALCFDSESEGCSSRQSTEVKFSPGGDKVTVRFREAPDLEWIRESMVAVPELVMRPGEHNPGIQNARDHKVEIQLMSKGDQLMAGLLSALGTDMVPADPLRVQWIGPKAGAQLRDAALKSIVIALIFIMAYIAFRFDLRFSPGAVVALMHDALLTIGCLILMKRELNLTTVAAILTIIGYSVNDTVVVYDRVRENLGKLRGSTFVHLINVSLSEMLSRTVLTSGTTIFSLIAFFVWGTGTLKDFALTLIIGLVLGTYSSIYIALPLTEWLDRKVFAQMSGVEKKAKRRRPIKKTAEVL